MGSRDYQAGAKGARRVPLGRLAASSESFAEGGQIARGDVHIRLLRKNAIDGTQIAVDVAEDENFHQRCPLWTLDGRSPGLLQPEQGRLGKS